MGYPKIASKFICLLHKRQANESVEKPLPHSSGAATPRRSAWGYLLTSVFVLKAIALGLAVSAMVVNMARAGVPEGVGIAIPFLVITALNLAAAASLFKNIRA